MIKLNAAYYPIVNDVKISKELSLNILQNNEEYIEIQKAFLSQYSFLNLKTFSFTIDGFLSLFLELKDKGRIAISLGETNAVVEAGKLYEKLGFKIIWIDLNNDGQINLERISKLDAKFLFISSYVMDTFVKIDLERIKTLTNATIISNATVEHSTFSDVIYFDPYKLTGFNTSGVLLHNKLLEEQSIGYVDNIAVCLIEKALKNQKFEMTQKSKFKKSLEENFGEDIYFFVDNNLTLEFTLHFALKNIRARELIRTLALDEILITNGEGCSLGLSQPSKIIQAMGYSEDISRNGISFSFFENINDADIEKTVALIFKRYRQIKVLT